MKGYDVNKATVRRDLPPRREPYWRELSKGHYLGFRKTETGSETWLARCPSTDSRYNFKSIGSVGAMSYDEAKQAAEVWFNQCRGGVVRAGTVEEACKEYVANMQVEKGERLAKCPEYSFQKLIYGKPFGRIPLDKLTSFQVREWRNGLIKRQNKNNRQHTLRESSANRIFRKLKAALNFAYKNRMVLSDAAWRTVDLLKGDTAADRARTLYLEPEQRGRILAECGTDTANLIRGLLYTMGRPQSNLELPVSRVRDFDATQQTLRLQHKKGRGLLKHRDVPLSDEAVAFFKQAAKDKLPSAYLFTYQGQPWSRHQWERELKAAIAAMNEKATNPKDRIPEDVVAYTFRHCAIVDRLKAGISIGKVADDAGTSVLMIERHYGKYAREDVSDRLARIRAF